MSAPLMRALVLAALLTAAFIEVAPQCSPQGNTRNEARQLCGAGQGTPQVALMRIYSNLNAAPLYNQHNCYGGNQNNQHTETWFINDINNNVGLTNQLSNQPLLVFLYTENSPCQGCLPEIVQFANRYPKSRVQVTFQRPFGSYSANDETRMAAFRQLMHDQTVWASNLVICRLRVSTEHLEEIQRPVKFSLWPAVLLMSSPLNITFGAF